MSRHDLKPKAGNPRVVSCCVGWDRPLQTYFAQVFFRTDREPDEGEALIWEGTDMGDILAPEAVLAIVEPYAEIPADLAEGLRADMEKTRSDKDGAAQAEVKSILYGSRH